MAYNPQDPNKLKDEDDLTGGESTPQLSGASSSLGSGSGTEPLGGSPSPETRAPSASGFTNVQKYIKANEQQGGALGQKIAGKIDSSISDASTKVGSAAQGYREKVNPNQFQFDAKSFNPMKVDQNQFGNLFNAPKSTYNDTSARDAINLANRNAAQIQTNEGRGELVGAEQTLSRDSGQNTAGLRTFDKLLFQGSGQGEAAIKNTAANLNAAKLQEKLTAQGNIARGIDQEAASNQATAAASARGAIGSQAKALQDQIAQSTAQQKAALAANQNRVFGALTNRQDVSDADLKSFGMNRDQNNQVRQAFDARQKQVLENEITTLRNQRLGFSGAIPEAHRKRENELLALRESGNMTEAQLMGVDVGFDLNPFFKKNNVSGFGAKNAVTSEQIARARALESLGQIAGSPLESIAPQGSEAFNQALGSTDLQALLNALKLNAVQKQSGPGINQTIQDSILSASGGTGAIGSGGGGMDSGKELRKVVENPGKALTGGVKKLFGR